MPTRKVTYCESRWGDSRFSQGVLLRKDEKKNLFYKNYSNVDTRRLGTCIDLGTPSGLPCMLK